MKNVKFLLLAIFVLQSCNVYYTKDVAPCYYLVARKEPRDLTLYATDGRFSFEIIGPTITEFCQTDEYLFIKQQPINKEGISGASQNDFYIIPLKLSISSFLEDNIIGPMNEKQFYHLADSLDHYKEIKFFKLDK